MITDDKTSPVLVVEDNPVDRHLVVTQLQGIQSLKHDLKLDFASDGAEALAKLAEKDFALLILDWNLPVLGQGEVLRQLRKNNRRIPVVVTSGRERQQLANELVALQATFLSKDLMTPQTFHSVISAALALSGKNSADFFRVPVSEIEVMAQPKILSKCGSCGQQLIMDNAGAGMSVNCLQCGSSLKTPKTSIVYTCPHSNCGQQVKIDYALKGEQVQCHSCNKPIMLPVQRADVIVCLCKRCDKTIEIPIATASKLLFCPKCDSWIRGPELKEIADSSPSSVFPVNESS